MYKTMWVAAVGEELVCEREPTNASDRYAVAALKSGVIIGHLLRKVTKTRSLFLRRGGCISCTVSGGRRLSSDLPEGGLEMPCKLLFKGKAKEMDTFLKL